MSAMASLARLAALAALLASSVSQVAAVGASGSGKTTRYWDCCKPSCAWSKPGITSPVKTCNINDEPLADSVNAKSGCEGGTSFMCSSQAPWAVNDNLAYGFAAVTADNPTCCTCYKLTFTDTEIKGKTMIVQATNTGYDVSGTQFDLAVCPFPFPFPVPPASTDSMSRFPVAALAYSTPAPSNGKPPPPSGAPSTAAPAATHVPRFPPP
ncbi:MAG: hypothetical protein LQ346_008000 [Caloplaca aetnensis]|nr:MAG: hypothetical protein LQ346_008000 [Caloplaca aetnensis]